MECDDEKELAMPKLPVPVPPADDVVGLGEGEFLFVIPAQRRPGALRPEALRGIAPSWLRQGEMAAELTLERQAA